MINAPAPIAPELAYKEEQHSKERQRELRIAKVRSIGISLPPPLAHPPLDKSGLANIY